MVERRLVILEWVGSFRSCIPKPYHRPIWHKKHLSTGSSRRSGELRSTPFRDSNFQPRGSSRPLSIPCPDPPIPLGEHSLSVLVKKRPFGTGVGPHSLPDSDVRTQTDEGASPTGHVPSDKGSAIRRHLKTWHEKHTIRLKTWNTETLPGFDVSGNAQNAISQSGEYDPNVLATSDDASRLLESQVQLESDGQVEDAALDYKLMSSGDMVNILLNRAQIPSIVTRSHRDVLQIYTIHGAVLHLSPRKAAFKLTGIVSSNELDPLMPYLPTDMGSDIIKQIHSDEQIAVPRDVGGPIINKMLELTKLADECYRKFAHRLDHVWKIMAPTSRSHVFGLDEIACKVFKTSEISPPMFWCLHRLLIQDERFLVDARSHRIFPRFTFLLQKHHDNRQTVMKWIRDYQEYQASDITASFDEDSGLDEIAPKPNALYAFIRKAQALVQNSRLIRDIDSIGEYISETSSPILGMLPNIILCRVMLTPGMYLGQVGLSKVKSDTPKVSHSSDLNSSPLFTKDDEKILQCLSDWVLSQQITNLTSVASIGPAILRATGIYDGLPLDQSTGFTFLKELGVITPWENKMIYSHEFPLPGHGVDLALDEMQQVAKRDYELKDSMEGLRKDWGNMPVFCVDALNTVEVDDGVSWEAAEGGTSWVHVHVANPSAFIDKDAAIAQYAAGLSASLYCIENRYPMIESEAVRRHCSLSPGCPTITFSARISDEGEILENEVSHGILHNVKFLTPETINKHLYDGWEPPKDFQRVTVGGEWPVKAKQPEQPLTDSDREILLKLRDVGRSRRIKRNPIVSFTASLPQPDLDLGRDHPTFGLAIDHPRRIVGDPLIAMPIKQFDPRTDVVSVQASEEFVSDLMLIAGEVAARWSAKRGIPVAYTGTVVDPALTLARDRFEREVVKPALAKDDYIPRAIYNRFFELTGRTSSSAVPLEHRYLKMPAYCRATSPLRRYGDIFSHWQIDAAVRYEASSGKSLVGNTEDHFLPFSRPKTEELLRTHDLRTERCNMVKLKSRLHWTAQWFYRAYYHGEAPIPETLSAVVVLANTAGRTCVGTIKELGIGCLIADNAITRAGKSFEDGDTWEIQVRKVDTYMGTILVDPIRLLEKGDA